MRRFRIPSLLLSNIKKVNYKRNKEEILKYRRDRYKKKREDDKNISVIKGEFILNFD